MLKKYLLRAFAYTLLQLIILHSVAQDNLKFKNFFRKNGLSSSAITSIAQTPDGYLWIGTEDGLNKFDGHAFVVYRNNPQNPNSVADNYITTLYVDRHGALWIGTRTSGLSRYRSETESFQNYKSHVWDATTLSSYYITDLAEDKHGNLWVSTAMGLNRYDEKTDSFERFFHEASITMNEPAIRHLQQMHADEQVIGVVSSLKGQTFATEKYLIEALTEKLSIDVIEANKQSIIKHALLKVGGAKIRAIEADSTGILWLAYEGNGVAAFDPSSKVLSKFTGDAHSIWEKDVRSLCIDNHNLWMGTRDGKVAILDIQSGEVKPVSLPSPSNNIEAIVKDHQHNVWVGDDYGLTRISRDGVAIKRHQYEEGNEFSLSSSSVKTIFEDRDNRLWVGCAQGGISVSLQNTPFEHLSHDPNAAMSLSKENVSALLEDSQGRVWVGYFTMGMDVWDPKTNQVIRFDYRSDHSDGIGKGTVFSIFEDSENRIWVGTYEGGLQLYDPRKRTFQSFRNNPADESSLSGNDVRAIDQDKDGNLWVAIHGHGINKFNPETKIASRYFADYDNVFNSLGNDWVYTVHVDRNDNVWAGTVYGVSVLFKGTDHFVTFSRDNSKLSHDHVRTIFESSDGNIWLGTHNGLTRYDPIQKTFTIYNEKDGIPNNTIHGIAEDDKGFIWLSTNAGISRLDTHENRTLNFTQLDGLQGEEYLPNSCFKGKNNLYFGGTNGLNIFNPNRVNTDTTSIQVNFASLKLFNKTVLAGEGILEKSLNHTNSFILNNSQNVFTISYVGISYQHPEQIQYAYRLVGFDEDWNYVAGKREVTYTNLDAGEYLFEVKAANAGGNWNANSRKVKIVVLPPFWKTYWAYAGYLLMVIVFLYIFRRINISKEKLKNEIRLREMEAEKTHELDVMKLAFFANISHEFKTPLTLINGPIETLIGTKDMPSEKQHEYYALIQRNAERLLRLINQVLDMSALDAGFMKLHVAKRDVVGFCRDVFDAFQYEADRAGITFSFLTNRDEAEVYFDSDKLEKVLYNILSNAMKFSQEGCTVQFAITVLDSSEQNDLHLENGEVLKVEISDSGIGISEDLKDKIFQRFFQGDCSIAKRNGSGIGLSLTKQLVECHHGSIEVDSDETGTRFTVWLPVSETEYAQQEILPRGVVESRFVKNISHDQQMKEGVPIFREEVLPQLLIVDDNSDTRKYLSLNLGDTYVVHEARNGKEAMQLAIDLSPDLIISDIVMPEVDGIELCRQIKSDYRTSHIPLVLLTGRNTEQQQLTGFEEGAEDYIVKPFSIEILKAKIRNMISARQRMKSSLARDFEFDPADVAQNKTDKRFMRQLVNVIEENLGDEDFSPELLADKINISRSQLYKKIKGLTGLSVSIFVRNIRLRKAAHLLATNSLTVSQVAYEVGFSDPGYFTKCFKEMYSKSPTEFMKEPTSAKTPQD